MTCTRVQLPLLLVTACHSIDVAHVASAVKADSSALKLGVKHMFTLEVNKGRGSPLPEGKASPCGCGRPLQQERVKQSSVGVFAKIVTRKAFSFVANFMFLQR